MFWFRVELDEKGKVLSCQQVAAATEDGGQGGVFFMRAKSAKIAGEIAYREYHRLRQVARRARYAIEGRCKCGRTRDRETPAQRALAHCPACLETMRKFNERETLKKKGLPVPPVDKAASFVERRNEEKLELLLEVEDQFKRNTMRNFGLWLAERIAKLQPKKPERRLRAV